MSLKGKWRIVEMPDYEADYPDMVEPAYIFLDETTRASSPSAAVPDKSGRELTEATSIEFSWDGNDEMDQVNGDGWAELQPDGSLQGEIRFHRGDEYSFVARKWTISTACEACRQHSPAIIGRRILAADEQGNEL